MRLSNEWASWDGGAVTCMPFRPFCALNWKPDLNNSFLYSSLSKNRMSKRPTVPNPRWSRRGYRFSQTFSGVSNFSGKLGSSKKPRADKPSTKSLSSKESLASESMASNTSMGPPNVGLHHATKKSRMSALSSSTLSMPNVFPVPASRRQRFTASVSICNADKPVQNCGNSTEEESSVSKCLLHATPTMPLPSSSSRFRKGVTSGSTASLFSQASRSLSKLSAFVS
mmetsp:Transcript_51555/g.122630  ORF Transcript_51555/g.122630 Transcript_51555/m.122630 type:complete len:226 (+) Transcript_51555:618-1295(+)